MNQKQKQTERIRPILAKGKPINDIIFVSKKMTEFDIAFTLILMRPTKEEATTKYRLTHHEQNDYGWTAKQINDYADNPMWGGDGIAQLVFGCAAALEVYTEDEIMTVLDAKKEYHK